MRDSRGRSPSPRRISEAVGAFRTRIEPATPLAGIQTVWDEAVGDGIAAVARPVSERDGTLTVECQSAVWAGELAFMEERIRSRLNEALDGNGPASIRFKTG